MLQLVDEGLEAFLRSSIDLSREEIDFSFDAPDDEWRAGLTKPTVDLFLWDIRRSEDENAAGRELVEKDGARQWRNRLPRIDLRYLVTAWTSEVRDEHRLLGSLLQSLLATSGLDPRFLPAPLADLEPYPSVKVARTDGKDFTELWSAVDGKLKPGLDVMVTVTVDPSAGIEAGPPTERLRIETLDSREPQRRSARQLVGGRSDAPPGSRVVSSRGTARIRPDGSYFIPGETGDAVESE